MATMFPYKWSDGLWRDAPESKPSQLAAQSQSKPKKEWTPTGFFKDYRRMSQREVALKASNARTWLECVLHDGPKPASEILALAKLEGIPARGLYRAKRHHNVKSVRAGGKGTGRRNPWIWQTPVSK